MSTAQDVLENIVNTKQGDIVFFVILHQILDKCCNIHSVANVYELKSQPSLRSKTLSKIAYI